MSRARHRAKGGAAGAPSQYGSTPTTLFNAQGSNTVKEVHQRKRGGAIHEVEGEHGKKRHDRPGRKRGGRVGADKAPLSSAAHVKQITSGEQANAGVPSK